MEQEPDLADRHRRENGDAGFMMIAETNEQVADTAKTEDARIADGTIRDPRGPPTLVLHDMDPTHDRSPQRRVQVVAVGTPPCRVVKMVSRATEEHTPKV